MRLAAMGFCCALALSSQLALAQLTIPTSGTLPAAPLTRSVILGDHTAALQAQWLAPVEAHQQAWINAINARANQAPSAGAPANFGAAAGRWAET